MIVKNLSPQLIKVKKKELVRSFIHQLLEPFLKSLIYLLVNWIQVVAQEKMAG